MKKIGFILIIVLFFMIIALPWGLSVLEVEFGEGTGEVRDLAKFPEEFSNDFFSQVNSYINDHSPMRTSIIYIENTIEDALGEFYDEKIVNPITEWLDEKEKENEPKPTETVPPTDTPEPTATPEPRDGECVHDFIVEKTQNASVVHDGYILRRCKLCGEGQITDVVYRTSLSSFNEKRTLKIEGAGYKGLYDWYFYAGDESINYFQGDNVMSTDEMSSWKSGFERLAALCDEKGINVCFLLLPNKNMIYSEYLPTKGIDKSKSDSEKRACVFAEFMASNSEVHYIYPLMPLRNAKVLYETYYQQDTHWNDVGGFIGAMEVYKAIGKDTTELYNVNVELTKKSGGDLVSLGVGPKTEYDNYSVNYKPNVNIVETAYYSNTVTGDNDSTNSELRVITTDANTTNNAVIIGDSYRHAIVRTICKDYKKTTVGHRRDFDTKSRYVSVNDSDEYTNASLKVLKNAVRNLTEGDLLVILAVERYDEQLISSVSTIADYIESLKAKGNW